MMESLENDTGVPVLNLENILSVLQEVRNVQRLSQGLFFVHKSWNLEISREDTLRAMILEWLTDQQHHSWRRIICALDVAGETSAANKIMSYAEPVADPSITENKDIICAIMMKVGDWDNVGYHLNIPNSRRIFIREQFSAEEERKAALARYWVEASPWASWFTLAKKLYHCEQQEAVEATRKFLPSDVDPTLTVDNLMELLEDVKEHWSFLATGLGVPVSKLRQINSQFQTDWERMKASLEHWVCTYPRPLWLMVADILEQMTNNKLAKAIRTKYVKASERSQQLFRQAMEKGYILTTNHNILFIGFSGSGKTHTMYLMQGKEPPEERNSTPCAEQPVRAVTTTRVKDEGTVWRPVDQTEHTQIIVQSAMATSTESTLSTIPLSGMVQRGTKIALAPPSLPTLDPPMPTASQASPTPSLPSTFDLRDTITGRMEQCVLSPPLHRINWVNLVDSGGQPQFQEVLPSFIRKRVACLFVQKLSESLDHYPTVELYSNGKLIHSYRSPLSNLQSLQCCMRTVQSQVSESESPLIVFVGTHKDLEHLSVETCTEKNKRLLEILPTNDRHVLFHGQNLIHPLNAKNPGPEDKQVATNLCREIIAHSPATPHKVPLQWYGLEVALQKMMVELGRGVLSMEECRAIADTLYFTPESFEAALKYLADLNFILYYEAVLPDIVFGSSQVILDKVSELVQFSYLLQGSPSMVIDGTTKRFCEQGLVTQQLLSHERFSRHYIKGLFGPEQLIQLLEELLLAAKVSDNEYLLPFTLPTAESVMDSCPSSVPPLLVYFPDGGPKLGVFCHLIAYLLSEGKWKLLFRERTPVQVTRTSTTFVIPGGVPGRVTIYDSFSTFFLISVSTDFIDRVSQVCPHIRETILAGLRLVTDNLGYKDSDPEDAFLCSGEGGACKLSPHPATVGKDSSCGLLACTAYPEKGRRITDKEQVWFPSRASPLAATAQGVPAHLLPTANRESVSAEIHVLLSLADLPSITDYLLDLDKPQVYHLGMSLGLSVGRVKSMFASAIDNVAFLDEVITAWLQRVDQVDKRGIPSWRSLVAALRSKRVGQNGIANDIECKEL